MKAILLAALLALSGAVVAQPKPDTRSDHLRTESAKAEAKTGQIGGTLDLNKAPEKDLAALPGIGPERARAIVKGRPYRAKSDLMKRNILDQASYRKVENILSVSPAK